MRISLNQTQTSDPSEAVVVAPLGHRSPFRHTRPARLSCKAFSFCTLPSQETVQKASSKIRSCVRAHTRQKRSKLSSGLSSTAPLGLPFRLKSHTHSGLVAQTQNPKAI